jgi:hypothetical protein
MLELLNQIDAAANQRGYFLALFAALTVPDIAGALADERGRASEPTYRAWAEENLPSWSTRDASLALWKYRCALLHQGTGLPDARSGIPRLIFREPDSNRGGIHGVTIATAATPSPATSATTIDIRDFCWEMTSAARIWLGNNRNNRIVQQNLKGTIRRYPKGIPPYLGGLPVIG